jgi:FKBP-type peptidyl-prolyl cis-trans isomerase
MRHSLRFFIALVALTAAASGQENLVTTASGLKYIEHNVGTGELAVPGATAETHFEGWVAVDGKKVKKFDSSIDRGRTYSFTVGVLERGNFPGFDEGVQGMRVGGKRELFIPSRLGFGAREIGNGLVPANSDLIFEVELLKVTKQP